MIEFIAMCVSGYLGFEHQRWWWSVVFGVPTFAAIAWSKDSTPLNPLEKKYSNRRAYLLASAATGFIFCIVAYWAGHILAAELGK